MQPLKLQVSLMCLLRRVKAAFADAFAVHHDLHAPFTLVRGNPQKARMIGFSRPAHILQITKPGNLAEVFKSVVLFVSILMVYVRGWKIARHVQPRKPMRQHFSVVDCNSPVPRVGWTTSTFTDKIRTALMRFPDELAGFWVVIKNGSDMVSGNHEFEFTMKVTK